MKKSFIDKNGNIHRNMKDRKRKPEKRESKTSSDEKMFNSMLQGNPKTGVSLGQFNSLKGMKPIMKNSREKTHGLGRCNFAYHAGTRKPRKTENPQLAHIK